MAELLYRLHRLFYRLYALTRVIIVPTIEGEPGPWFGVRRRDGGIYGWIRWSGRPGWRRHCQCAEHYLEQAERFPAPLPTEVPRG